ncbi:MAG: 3-methyl-2-oxobutanoate hydroxymethyltransferase, partial [Candidatus Lokiarchaeota archaeon]|nr:3-methyl-2-oxobutanoate hydroxymethyltransferase [Candidatus Lokiarchaeota archaeon]
MKSIIEKKQNGEKIVTITAYDYALAKLVDACDLDLILVGDSLAMVMLGYQNTLSVSMDEMIHHTKAVSRAVSNALIVGDMPFLSYKINKTDAVRNAGRFIQEGGAEAVKVEGGTEICATIKAMIDADIEVMGHIGLTPQKIYRFGGFMVQGKTIENAKHLILDAKNLQEAGVFSIVLESIPWQIAELITKAIDIPTIGIGAGPYCDGQILVLHDMLGIFTDFKPKFLKYFGNVRDSITEALKLYKNEVVNDIYPNKDYSYDYVGDQLEDLKEWVENNDLNKEAAELSKTMNK